MSQISNPQISVIMPCHNAAAYVAEAIGSVHAQTFPDWELIVVDDGSGDDSVAIITRLAQEDSRIRLLRQDNQGPYPARNFGLRHARGEFVAFLDADDWWDRTFLEKMRHGLDGHKADLAYCGWQNVVEAGEDRPPYVPPDYLQEDLFERLLRSCPWPIHAALTRRRVLEAVGGFSTRCFSSMDYDLWLRIAAVTRHWVRVPEVLAYYRWHGKGQISAVKWRQVLEARRVRQDFVAAHREQVAHLSPSQLRQLIDGPLREQAYQALWRRDLESAQKLFRTILRHQAWQWRDCKYLLASLLPAALFQSLVRARDVAA
ncbi:MAG TPA: glycosyltransferase [Methylothermaceae bacterium]|nr:glycosyltransferase [Methylothermaceae bacterium]